MEELKDLNVDAYDWLAKIPPQHWARSHFSEDLEYCREYLIKRIVLVCKVIDKCDGSLTPTATEMLESIKREAEKCTVKWNGGHRFQVSGLLAYQCVVDVNEVTCSCRRWQLTGMPCKHAIASIWNLSLNGVEIGLPETLVDPVYWLNTWKHVYSYKIDPIIGHKHE